MLYFAVMFILFVNHLFSGIMHGSIYINTVVMLQRYFDKYRTLTTGLVFMADSLGTFSATPVYMYLIRQYGWRNVTSYHACITLQMVTLSALFRPPFSTKPSNKLENHNDKDINGDPPRTHKPRIKTISKVLGLSLFCDEYFVGFLFANVLVIYSVTCMYHQNPSRALSNGINQMQASMLPSFIGMCSAVSRLISSVIGNMKCTNRAFQVSAHILLGGTIVCLSCFGKTFVASAIFAGAFGFALGENFFTHTICLRK